MKLFSNCQHGTTLLSLTTILILAGCSKSKDEVAITASSPKEAAASLDSSFATAPPAVKENVAIIADALRKKDFEKAVVSLHSVKQGNGITLQQGLAIHSSELLLERELINGIERGDPRAKAAYELLKQAKRN